ncbi:MAG: hypothetical protein ACFB16_05325 [Phormidesmis sp.]
MTDSENKKESFVNKLLLAVVVPVAIALLAGGTSPWWWSEIFDRASSTPTSTADEGNKGEEEDIGEAIDEEEARIADEAKQRLEDRAAYREVEVRRLIRRGIAIQGTDPREITFNILGRASLEEGEQPSVLEPQSFTEYSVVTITNDGSGDDSVRGTRHRLEFEKIDNQRWQIAWAGMQQRCSRGQNPGEWTTELCP